MERGSAIDVSRSAERIRRDVEALAGRAYTRSDTAICRYAYTDEYRRTLDWFRAALEQLGFAVAEDAVGNFLARNRPAGTPVFGLGSHCDSNRNGGKWDGTLGVVVALEVCRLAREHELDLPLQLISWLEEEGSGFGQMLLGSRICTQRIDDADLEERFRSLDDGRPFAEHAREAGHAPERWRESIRILDDLTGWIELHIEQARVLQDTGGRLGVVTAIAGYVHADLVFTGRADHAGATPMEFRLDAAAGAAECVLELERLARAAGGGTVGTAGEAEVSPGLINVVPGRARISIDVRGVDEERFRGVLRDLTGWIELHIEQARVLQDTGERLGVVTAIAGYVHADLVFTGRADHAGATPMEFRLDAAAGAAECVLELERLARAAGGGTVGTAGEADVEPGLINVVPGRARVSIDVRGVDEERFRGVVGDLAAFAEATAARRGLGFELVERQTLSPTPMDARVVAALEASAQATGAPFRSMPSGAAHDTMCVAAHVPSAMVFVPCRDGVSHSPLEDADPADAALAAGVILDAVTALV